MATYCYTRENEPGVVEEEFPVGSAPPFITKNGKTYMRDIGMEQRGVRDLPQLDGERWSLSMGCPKFQEQEFRDNAVKHGFGDVDFHRGEAVFPSKARARQYAKFFGYGDYDGGRVGRPH